MPYIIKQVLGDRLGRPAACDVALAITVCTLTVHAAAVRLVFAMARDDNLPFSGGACGHVPESSRTPVLPGDRGRRRGAAILVVQRRTSPDHRGDGLGVDRLGEPRVPVRDGADAGCRRLRGAHSAAMPAPRQGLFTLGRWGLPVNVAGGGLGLGVVVNIGWPRPEIYGDDLVSPVRAPRWPRRDADVGGRD